MKKTKTFNITWIIVLFFSFISHAVASIETLCRDAKMSSHLIAIHNETFDTKTKESLKKLIETSLVDLNVALLSLDRKSSKLLRNQSCIHSFSAEQIASLTRRTEGSGNSVVDFVIINIGTTSAIGGTAVMVSSGIAVTPVVAIAVGGVIIYKYLIAPHLVKDDKTTAERAFEMARQTMAAALK